MLTLPTPYVPSTYREVHDLVFSDPYTGTLPTYRPNILDMCKGFSNVFFRASKELTVDKRDIWPHHQKLLHGVAVCLTGTWRITQPTAFTGYFAQGAEGLIFARASSALGGVRGQYRGFGIGAKLFPTLDPDARLPTGNFVVMETIGGTRADRMTDVALTNEPGLGIHPGLVFFSFVGTNVLASFNILDQPAMYRPIDQIAALGLPEGAPVVSPVWMRLTHAVGNGKSEEPDLRDELRVEHYVERKLRYDISVATEKGADGAPAWSAPIGEIVLTESVTSNSGDHRIRFFHPLNRGRPVPKALTSG